MVDLVDINANDTKSTKYSIKFLIRNTKLFTKEFLRLRNVTGIASIKIPSKDYINESKNLTQ